MQVAVIGGGVVGVCTAYYLAEAGHEVVVIERHANVAEQSSFGHAGILSVASAMPWAAPGVPRKFLSYLFSTQSPVRVRPRLNHALMRWIRMWLSECELERYRGNLERMQRLTRYSQELFIDLRSRYELQYEQTKGHLQLFRSERDLQLAAPALSMLEEHGMPHSLLAPEEAHALEPGMRKDTALKAALHFAADEAGNCPLFTKQMRYIAQSMGVQFHFNTEVTGLMRKNQRLSIAIADNEFDADAIVLAAGSESADMLASFGVRIPLHAVKGYSATAPIKDFDAAPLGSVTDEAYKLSISRLGNRIRIAGTAELGYPAAGLHQKALRTLIQTGDDWFPHAANFRNATFWSGVQPMLPDGVPMVGATPVRNLFINIGHGANGWALAPGTGKLVADLISGNAPDIDLDGLTLNRYG